MAAIGEVMGEVCAIRMFGPSHCFQRSQFAATSIRVLRTSSITIAADRTARWAKQFHAARQGPSLGNHAERSPPNLCLAGYTTFTAPLHDKFLRPTTISRERKKRNDEEL
jgi:hypothetical protein